MKKTGPEPSSCSPMISVISWSVTLASSVPKRTRKIPIDWLEHTDLVATPLHTTCQLYATHLHPLQKTCVIALPQNITRSPALFDIEIRILAPSAHISNLGPQNPFVIPSLTACPTSWHAGCGVG